MNPEKNWIKTSISSKDSGTTCQDESSQKCLFFIYKGFFILENTPLEANVQLPNALKTKNNVFPSTAWWQQP